MALQTVQSAIIQGLSFTYDDVSNDITEIKLDCTNPTITAIPSGVGNNVAIDEIIVNAFIDELATQLTGKLSNLDYPLILDADNTFFDNQGLTTRDSGTTDANGNAITETQLFRVRKFVQFFKFDANTVFASTNSVNNND